MNGDETKHGEGLAPAPDEAQSREPGQETPAAPGLGQLTTQALRFLSTASTETISGIAVGLAACTYLVLGRVGLVLIGALGGVVLHATWEGHTSHTGSTEDVRKEKGLDIVKRILDLRDSDAKSKDKDEDQDSEEVTIGNTFEGVQPETAAALNELVDAVIRDYVKWWYNPIIPKDQSFPAACRQTLTRLLSSISLHLSKKRPADMFLDFVANSSSIVIVFLDELSSALSASQGATVPAAEAIHKYLAANPESNLANVLNTKQQSKKFNLIANDLLQNFLEKPAYECDPARIFLKQILAEVALEMALKSCSRPEWINGWIVYLLEDGEPDLSSAIDASVDAETSFADSFDVIDGNVGNIGVARQPKSQAASQEKKKHKKRLSRAEEAMEEAIQEAKRLSQLIAEEENQKSQKKDRIPEEIPKSATTTSHKGHVPKHSDAAALRSTQSEQPSSQLPKAQPLEGKKTATSTTDKPQPLESRKTNTSTAEKPHPLEGKKTTTSTAEKPQPSSTKPPVSSAPPTASAPFTSFDQIIPQNHMAPLEEEPPSAPKKPAPLTLHNASISIYDDAAPGDNGKIRGKPNGDYLVQIEPSSSQHPGWMIVRRYADFETLHEVLRRIAQVSGVTAFTEQHTALPSWRDHTKASLRGELERYLRDACWYQPLAESEGMKRFLDKDQQQLSTINQKTGFPGLGWPTPSAFENMGKGVLDVLANAPKGVAGGGKAIGGGITGVFNNIGNLGQKKPNGNVGTHPAAHPAGRASTSTLPLIDSLSAVNGFRKSRASEDSLRVSPIIQTQPPKIPPMERRPSYNSIHEEEHDREPRPSSERSSLQGRRSATHSRDPSRAPSRRGTPLSSPVQEDIGEIILPPPPCDISDDYGPPDGSSSAHSRVGSIATTTRTSISTAPSQLSPNRASLSTPRGPSLPVTQISHRKRKESTPLTEQETRVTVELLFAVISEVYTLSSAWNIRRTLLNAAKTFLLRPGNPSLSSIQSLIQDSIIASNISDSGIAAHLRKLRENTLPTEEELKAYPGEMTMEEKERLRVKARKLLVERGVPDALSGVMGQAATSEAMGRIFDALQVEEVTRGLVFGLLLQGVRAVTH